MKYNSILVSSFTWAFLLLVFINNPASSSISKASIYPDSIESSRPFLEPINGTKNYRMHGKKAKDDKWAWDGREGRYIYCVRESESKCEELEYTKQCFGQNLPYQSTTLDLTNYYSQDQSLEKLISYQALKFVPKCWSVIQPFLCAVFFPKCEKINGVDMVYLPSLEMCKITMEPCRILYNSSYFPDFLKCNESNFPSKCNNDVREMKFNLTGQCLSPLVPAEDPANSYKDIEGCGLECKDPLYTDDEHRQIRKLVGWGASICVAFHLFALFTFTIDWHNGNKYPALIIFYINLCFMISCLGWLAQFIPGRRQDIVCRLDNTLKQGEPSGGDNLSCIVVFILVYYFLMAAICWFVIFTYAWHMSLKSFGKIQVRINKKASYFHLIAWSIPLVLTITILAISEVDGNYLVGICFVGYINHSIRGGFILGPVLCCLLIGGYFLIRGLVTLINLKISSKQITSLKAKKKIRQSIVRMGICSVLTLTFIVITILCHFYEFRNSGGWAESLRISIICKITSAYSDDDSSSCRLLNRPSISILQLHLMSLFASGIVMASFVFTPSTVHIWGRFFRRKFGQKVEEPLKLQKHKVIAQAFAKRKEFQDQERVSISFHNSHTDPVGLKFDLNSAVGSNDFSSTWANNLPRFVNRRCALTGCASSSSHRRASVDSRVDSEFSISVRTVAVESRRNSTESQVSVKIAEMKTVQSRTRGGPKSKPRSSRHQHRRDFSSSRRYSRKESSTSMESQIIAMTQKGSHHQSTATTAEMGIMVPVGNKRRTGIGAFDRAQINELISTNKNLLPFLTTSEDEKSKSSMGSFSLKTEEFLKHLGLTQKITAQESNYNEDMHIEDYDSNSDDKNLNSDRSETGMTAAGRNSKNSNRSIGSKKSLKINSRLRKTRKSSRSISKTANPLAITNGSGRMKADRKSEKDKKSKEKLRSKDESFSLMGMELTPMNLQGSYSGRSDVGIQTETFSSIEKMMKQDQEDDDDDYDPLENHKLLSKRVSLSSAAKRRDTRETSLTESQKLELLLLPSK